MHTKSLKRTALYSNHVARGAKIVPFAGYEMPVQYTGVLEETLATRRGAGLFDVSHMGQFVVEGTGAFEAVQGLFTNDLARIRPGRGQYSLLCNDAGGITDDLIVYWRGENSFYVCVNAANRNADADVVRKRLARTGVNFRDESDETALLAVQGPLAESLILKAGGEPAIAALKYFHCGEFEIAGVRTFVARTGYTGEDGFEIYLPNENAVAVWDRLLEAGAGEAVPVGLGARDTLRIEMGYPLHGSEIDSSTNPWETGLGWVVRLQKPADFLGKTALADLKTKPRRKPWGIVLDDRRIPRRGYTIFDESGPIGTVSSGTFSPHAKSPIALVSVKLDCQESATYTLQVRQERLPLKIQSPPFVAAKTRK